MEHLVPPGTTLNDWSCINHSLGTIAPCSLIACWLVRLMGARTILGSLMTVCGSNGNCHMWCTLSCRMVRIVLGLHRAGW
jgi:hypothetical protein